MNGHAGRRETFANKNACSTTNVKQAIIYKLHRFNRVFRFSKDRIKDNWIFGFFKGPDVRLVGFLRIWTPCNTKVVVDNYVDKSSIALS